MSVNGNLVEQFISVTGSTEEIAQKLLHDNSNNLQNAVTAFLDNHHKEGECSKPTENGVRAPIPPTRGVLVDDPLPMSSRWTRKRRIQHSVFNHLDQSAGPRRPPADKEVAVNGGAAAAAAAEQPRPARRHSKKKKSQILGVMGKSDLQAQREFDAKEMKIQQLTEMYQPPVDMAYNGTQDTVEEEARNKGKLVLVNLQDITDFRCQVINRDVWSKKLLRQFVMQNFIFWQPYLDSPEGDHFLITYNCVHFPFVCCINPWTGKNIHTFRDVHNADRLLAELRQFVRENRFYLHRMYGLKQEADAKKLKLDETALAAAEGGDDNDDARLAAAISASLAQSLHVQQPSSSSSSSHATAMDDDVVMEEEPPPPDRKKLVKQFPSSSSHCGGATARLFGELESKPYGGALELLVRGPYGEREVLTMAVGDTLHDLSAELSRRGFDTREYEAVANFPFRNLTDRCDRSLRLDQVGLRAREVIFVREKL